MLPETVATTVGSLLEQCVAVANEALRLLGQELGVANGLNQLVSRSRHRLRLIRVHGSTQTEEAPDTPEAAPMPEHADHSLLSLHVPLDGGDVPWLCGAHCRSPRERDALRSFLSAKGVETRSSEEGLRAGENCGAKRRLRMRFL